MIRSQNERNCNFNELFSFIRFEFLSVESIQDFISLSCKNFESFEQFFSLDLWTTICCRLCLSVDVKCSTERYCVESSTEQHRVESLHFVPQSHSPLAGIIAYLTFKHGGNVHDQGIVNVSGSTTNGS
jgi:hypothetical protein